MTAIAVGAKSSILMDVETSFGVPPTTHAGVILPLNTFAVKPTRSKNSSATLTGRYDPAQPFDGNLEVSGSVVVPLDARAFGHWLKAMFGAPTTTGASAPYTHVWKSNSDMPSLAMQAKYGTVFGLFTGCKVSSMEIQAGGDGELTASVNLVGRDADYSTTNYNSSAASVALQRFSNFQGSILSGGSSLGVVTNFSLTLDFGLQTDIRAIGDQGRVYDLPQGTMKISGGITVFFTDATLLNKAKASEELALSMSFTIDEDNSLTFDLPEVQLSYDGPTVDGPTGIKQEYKFEAYYNNAAAGAAVVATLVNDKASY